MEHIQMADTLFGYSIDEKEGTLVVTLSGTLTQAAISHLRERIDSGENWPVRTLLSPVLPLGRLLSSAVPLRSQLVASDPGTHVDEEALNQQVDQTLAAFMEQMDEFRTALAELDADPTPSEGSHERPQASSVTPERTQKPGARAEPAASADADADASTAQADQAPATPATAPKGSQRTT
jgi:hypothetical protein